MKKIIFLLLAVALVTGGFAQLQSGSTIRQLNQYDKDTLNRRIDSLNPLKERGYIIQEHFSVFSGWQQSGGFSVSGNKLSVPNGTNDFLSFVKNSAYGTTNLRKWTMNIYKYIVPTITSTSYGVGVGISTVVPGNNRSLSFRFCTDAAKAGLIEVYYAETATPIAVSSNALSIAAGDSTSIKVQRILNTFEITWKNLTKQGQPFVIYRFEASSNGGGNTPPNGGKFAFYAFGGATTVDSVSVQDNELLGASLAVAGTSIDVATTSANPNQTWTAQFMNFTGVPLSVFAGNSNRIDDINASEIIAHAPKNILLSLATNNLANGDDTTTMKTKLSALVSLL
jgi:hypothetical protein